jgi:hypothetical protein
LDYEEIELSRQSLLKSAMTNNPDLKIINYEKEKFSNKLSLYRSELLPNLSFTYYNQKIGDDTDFWGVEFGVGIPLWFWWEPTGNIKESGFELKIAASDEINISKMADISQSLLITKTAEQLQFEDEQLQR